MPETYEQDDYSQRHYADGDLNFGQVSSFSITDVAGFRRVVDVNTPGGLTYNSERDRLLTEERLGKIVAELIRVDRGPQAVTRKAPPIRGYRSTPRNCDRKYWTLPPWS
jgi:hypothetical protein